MNVNLFMYTSGQLGIRWTPNGCEKNDAQSLHFMETGESKRAPINRPLHSELLRQFNKRIEDIRRAAYEQGRRSVRNKAQRCTSFNGCINTDSVGW
jgi:hypothetical protein